MTMNAKGRWLPLLVYYSLQRMILVPRHVTDALHYLPFETTVPKCMSMEVPRGTTLFIEYIVPDLRPPPGLQDSGRRRLQAVETGDDGGKASLGSVNYSEKKKKIEEAIKQMEEMGVGSETIIKLKDELAQITALEKKKQIEDAIKQMEEMGVAAETIGTLKQELNSVTKAIDEKKNEVNSATNKNSQKGSESGDKEAQQVEDARQQLHAHEQKAKIEEIKKRIEENERTRAGDASKDPRDAMYDRQRKQGQSVPKVDDIGEEKVGVDRRDEMYRRHEEERARRGAERMRNHEEMMRKEVEEMEKRKEEEYKKAEEREKYNRRKEEDVTRYRSMMEERVRPYMLIRDGIHTLEVDARRSDEGEKRFLEYNGKEHYEVQRHGRVQICFKFPGAYPAKPMHLHFTIDDMEPPVDETDEIQDMVARQIRGLESEIHYLQRVVNRILSSADMAKDLETDFHDHSIKMNGAAYWWPMCQVFVLVLTGVFQARTISGFLKTRFF
mmetsp:Transcript_37266/g.45539  ORF Transcript_37266/g.45539 Transcript_37266/m.45539 type:complete len:498 (-) Transcript_37266:25-1518(-)